VIEKRPKAAQRRAQDVQVICGQFLRAQIVHKLVENFGIPLAEVAGQVGVSTSAISKALNRTMKD